MFPRTSLYAQAFTLLEMLVVIAVISLLSTVVAPALKSVLLGQTVTSGAYDTAAFLEAARNEAVTRQTYVWVGFKSDASAGSAGLVEGAAYSRDGSGVNTAASNLAPLGKAIRVRNVALSAWGDLKAGTRNLFTGQAPASVATNNAGVAFSVGRDSFEKSTLTFTPRGEAMLVGSVGPDEGFDACIDVSFRQSQGGVVRPEADDTSVIVDGSTGALRILRMQ